MSTIQGQHDGGEHLRPHLSEHPAAELRHLQRHWSAAGATSSQRVVLAGLWARATELATEVDVRTLADDLGRSAGSVQKVLTALEVAGLVLATNAGPRTKTTRRLVLAAADACSVCVAAAEAEAEREATELRLFGLGPVDNPAICAPQKRAEPNEPSARLRSAQNRRNLRASEARVSTNPLVCDERGGVAVELDGELVPLAEALVPEPDPELVAEPEPVLVPALSPTFTYRGRTFDREKDRRALRRRR